MKLALHRQYLKTTRFVTSLSATLRGMEDTDGRCSYSPMRAVNAPLVLPDVARRVLVVRERKPGPCRLPAPGSAPDGSMACLSQKNTHAAASRGRDLVERRAPPMAVAGAGRHQHALHELTFEGFGL